ncbi:hypothetical protein EYD10_12493 [Varanus komodoensis]|nr:hypothetical protein EYD10_12493 [Varanus komodoensis]
MPTRWAAGPCCRLERAPRFFQYRIWFKEQDLGIIVRGSHGKGCRWRSGLNCSAAGLVDRKVAGSNLHNGVSSRCSVPAPANLAVRKHADASREKDLWMVVPIQPYSFLSALLLFHSAIIFLKTVRTTQLPNLRFKMQISFSWKL